MYSMDRRTFLAGSAAAATTAGLAACGRSSSGASGSAAGSSSGAAAGDTINYFITNPTSIDPFDIEEFNGAAVAFQLFDPLTVYDYANMELKPLTAESWESNDTADVWTFHIKKGLKFHDGTDVTAKSFKFSWERICDPNTTTSPSIISYHLQLVKGYDDMVNGKADELAGVTCPDDYTLQVELNAPFADFPFVVSCTPLAPVADCAKDDFNAFFTKPIGNGPFMMADDWEDGQYIDLVPFPDYGGDEPAKVDGVHFAIYKDSDTAFREFEGGNLDMCDIPAGRIKETIEKYGQSEDGYTVEAGKQTLLGEVMYTEYLAYNVNDETLSDKRVRQALSLAINRQNLCDTLYEGTAVPSGDIVPPGIKGNDETTWVYTAYDPDKAGQLLDEAGYTADADGNRGISLKIMVSTSSNLDEFASMQNDWKQIGVDVQIEQLEYATMLDKYTDGSYQIGSRGWTADYPIMYNFLQPLMYSTAGDNVSHYASEEFDAKLDEACGTVDEDARVALMHEADAIGAEDMPIIPILHKALNKVGSDRFKNLMVDAGRTPELRYAELA